MKVLVISDTHHDIQNAVKILKYISTAVIGAIIHCGDHIDDAMKLKKLYPSIEVYAVYGNCDGMAYGQQCTRVVHIEGVSILITHGHKHGIKWGSYNELLNDAVAEEVQLAICGHSHSAYLEKVKGIILLNPGSMSEPRDSKYPSYAVLDIDDGQIKDVAIMQIADESTICTHPICNAYRSKQINKF